MAASFQSVEIEYAKWDAGALIRLNGGENLCGAGVNAMIFFSGRRAEGFVKLDPWVLSMGVGHRF